MGSLGSDSMMMMEQNKHVEVCSDDKKLPPLSAIYPWLGVRNLEDLTDKSFSNLDNLLFEYQCRIPELSGKRIRGCFHGWIILSNELHNNMWSLWDPMSTSNIISLPPLFLKDGDYDSIRECCLSAPPDNPNSVILLTRTNKPTFVFCQLSPKKTKSVRKKPRWTEMSYAYQLKKITGDGHLLHSLTFCNGHIYALSDDNWIHPFVIRVEIVVKDREVVVQLSPFGVLPFLLSYRCLKHLHFLAQFRTELFYIAVGFRREIDKTPGDVFLFKCDMASADGKVFESLTNWDMSGVKHAEEKLYSIGRLEDTHQVWEEAKDLNEGIFVVDLAHGHSEFYNYTIGLKIGGYIHFHDKVDKLMYSYHLNNKTIVPSSVPFSELPTSCMSMSGCWLEDDHREARFTVDFKQQDDETMMINFITNSEVEVSESHLLDVPFEVLEMLMKFCFGVEYMNFRATCKGCHLAAPLIQWRDETELDRLQNYSLASPWLMVVDQILGVITFTDPLLGDNYYTRISQLPIADETICCSRFGWLLFKTSDHCPVFFNPFTKDLRELPRTNYNDKQLWFSAPPTSPDCMVVGFVNGRVEIHYVSGEPIWNVYQVSSRFEMSPICFPTYHYGDLYYLYERELRVFKHLGENNISSEVLIAEAPRSWCGSPAQYFLVKCDQHLLLVVMGGFGEPMEVFKLNDSRRDWDKVNDVGKHMIYICDTTCICIEAKLPEMENKIYLAQSSSRNKKIVFYSLETSTFHMFDGKNIQENLGDVYFTTHLSAHAWIEPSWLERQ